MEFYAVECGGMFWDYAADTWTEEINTDCLFSAYGSAMMVIELDAKQTEFAEDRVISVIEIEISKFDYVTIGMWPYEEN